MSPVHRHAWLDQSTHMHRKLQMQKKKKTEKERERERVLQLFACHQNLNIPFLSSSSLPPTHHHHHNPHHFQLHVFFLFFLLFILIFLFWLFFFHGRLLFRLLSLLPLSTFLLFIIIHIYLLLWVLLPKGYFQLPPIWLVNHLFAFLFFSFFFFFPNFLYHNGMHKWVGINGNKCKLIHM